MFCSQQKKKKTYKTQPLKIPSYNIATFISCAWSAQLDSNLPQLNNITYMQEKSCLH